MNKEKITIDAIRSDLIKIANYQVSNKSDWRFSYIVPFTALAVLLGVITKNVFIGVVPFCFAAYHIFRFIAEYKEYKAKKSEVLSLIDRGEISISDEIFSHIAKETVYEPHTTKTITKSTKTIIKSTKTITVYHFEGGSAWRAPLLSKHYEWSKEYSLSPGGLDNISIAGDKFYLVSLQEYHDVSYIYPCKFFELDKSLENS